LVISETALSSLKIEQKKLIEQYTQILPLSVPTIEMSGGSVRCMIAGIHLAARN